MKDSVWQHPAASSKLDGWAPLGLVVLSIVPVIAGAVRIHHVAGGALPTPDDARFLASPVPVVVHIFAASIFSLLGAFQFSPALRGRNRWHRTAGRVLIPCGLATALTGFWMTLFYAWGPVDGIAVYGLRLVFGGAMLISLALAITAIIRRDFRAHGAWMIRAYAIGLGAGTQVLTHLPWFVMVGAPDVTARAWLMGAGWVINIAVAEWFIRCGSQSALRPRALEAVDVR